MISTMLRNSWLAALLILSACLSLYAMEHVDQRGHYTGDETAGFEIWTGGLNFYKHGFLALRLAPIQKSYDVADATTAVKTPKLFYTHYPAGPDIMQGIMFHLGLHTPWSHKVFALGASMAGMLLVFLALQVWFSPVAALWGVTAMALSPAFLFFNNSRYKAPWLYLLGGALLFLLAFMSQRASTLSRRWYLGLWAGFFALALTAAWFSLDDVAEFMAPGLAIPFFFPRGQRLRRGLPLMLALPLGEATGFALHMARNVWLFGSWEPAYLDMLTIFTRRTGQGLTSYDPVKHITKFILGLQWFYTLPLLGLAALGWARKIGAETRRRPAFIAMACGTALAVVLWQIAMREHAMIHASTYCHADAFIVLGVAGFFDSLRPRETRLRAAGALVLLYLLAHSALAVANVEGNGAKRALIDALLPDPGERTAWSCAEHGNLAGSIERAGAKAIVEAMKPEECGPRASAPAGFRGRLASLVLYWR